MIPGTIGIVTPAAAATSRKRKIRAVVEEELADRPRRRRRRPFASGPRCRAGASGSAGASRDRSRPTPRNRRCSCASATSSAVVLVAVRVALVRRVEAGRRVAAQRDDVPDAGAADRRARRSRISSRDAPTQVRCAAGFIVVSLHEAGDRRVGALARRAAGAVGDRDEGRVERLEPPRRLPQVRLHLRRLRREELERDADRRARPARAGRAWRASGELRVGFLKSVRNDARVLGDPQRDRQLAGFAGRRGRPASTATAARPASARKPSISASGKPSRRWAKSVRRNSCVMGVEIDDHQPARGRERARGLVQRPGRDRRGSAAPDG